MIPGSLGAYDHVSKEILLINPQRDSEEVILNTILHEMEHWAQELYLPMDDCLKMSKICHDIIFKKDGRHQDALIEKINPFKVWLYKEEFMSPSGIRKLYKTDNGPSRSDEEKWKAYWRAAKFE